MTDPASPVPQPVLWQKAVVTEILSRTPGVKSFFLTPAQPFAFQAGQHVDVRLTAPDGYRAMRSYSLASAPEASGTIELAVERLADGEVSPFFHDVVVPGDEIELRGPLGGYFLWPAVDDGPLLLAGGGSGVVPFMSMVRHRREMMDSRPVLLLYSARTWNDVIFRDELLELDAHSDGFTLVLTLTREPAKRRQDFARRVDAAMLAEVLGRLPPVRRAYVCGSSAFVNAAADGALSAGVAASEILTERYGV